MTKNTEQKSLRRHVMNDVLTSLILQSEKILAKQNITFQQLFAYLATPQICNKTQKAGTIYATISSKPETTERISLSHNIATASSLK